MHYTTVFILGVLRTKQEACVISVVYFYRMNHDVLGGIRPFL